MIKIIFDKLVRDKIPLKLKGSEIFYKKDMNTIKYILKKIHEELKELENAVQIENHENISYEIADLYEVLGSLVKFLKIDNINHYIKDKKEKNGSFEEYLIIDYIKMKDDSPFLAYYENNSDYKIIKE